MKRTYKSIENLAKNTIELTLENILHKRAYHKTAGWISINDLMTEDLADEISQLLGGINTTKQGVFNSLLYHRTVSHWGLRRIIWCKHTKRFKYVAGQDYTYELSEIRKALK